MNLNPGTTFGSASHQSLGLSQGSSRASATSHNPFASSGLKGFSVAGLDLDKPAPQQGVGRRLNVSV